MDRKNWEPLWFYPFKKMELTLTWVGDKIIYHSNSGGNSILLLRKIFKMRNNSDFHACHFDIYLCKWIDRIIIEKVLISFSVDKKGTSKKNLIFQKNYNKLFVAHLFLFDEIDLLWKIFM